jgi:hypothetical protein
MVIKLDKDGIEAIESILKRGNDVEVRRRRNGYIVLEVKKQIKADTSN